MTQRFGNGSHVRARKDGLAEDDWDLAIKQRQGCRCCDQGVGIEQIL